MYKNKHILIITITVALIMLILFSGLCFIPANSQKKEKQSEKKTTEPMDTIVKGKLPKQDTTLLVDKHSVIIKTCMRKKNGTFLVLHGWNLPVLDWCTKTDLCSKVTEQGYCVVLPDMGKSIYQESNFKETRFEWRSFPTRQWLSDTLIPLLQKKYDLLQSDENNYIVGLSTGARGVALLLLDFPDLFKGAAGLSGDYNQLQMPADNLMTGYYGPISKFRYRWETTDNPIMRIKEYRIPIYLGHGKIDKIVPPEQTMMFYDSLIKYHPAMNIKLHMPDEEHNYEYWDSEVNNILKFFDILE